MKRFLATIVELSLAILAIVVWTRAFTVSPRPRVALMTESMLNQTSVAERRESTSTLVTVPEPIELARWFGEVPRPAFRAPDVLEREAPQEPEPEFAPFIRVSGTLTIEGQELISAIDTRVGRAVLIGESSELADWILIEERSEALLVEAEGVRLLVPREVP